MIKMKHGIKISEMKDTLEVYANGAKVLVNGKHSLYEGLEHIAKENAGPLAYAEIRAGEVKVIGKYAVADLFTGSLSISNGMYVIDSVVSEAFLPGDEFGDFYEEHLPQIEEEVEIAATIAKENGVQFDPITCVFCYDGLTEVLIAELPERFSEAIEAVKSSANKFAKYLAKSVDPIHKRESEIVKKITSTLE